MNWLLAVLAMILAGVACFVGLMAASPTDIIVPALLVFLAIMIPIALWSRAARSRRARTRLLADHPEIVNDSLSVAVERLWQRGQPKVEEIRSVVRAEGAGESPRGHVVILGPLEMPEIGDLRFEPYIITATDLLGRRLFVIPISPAVLSLWLLQVAHVIPGRIMDFGNIGYVAWIGIAAAAAWVWKSGIRPTYFRLAPGIIQVLEYRLWHRKPAVRNYPMQAGTLIVVRREAKSLHATLLRDDRKDALPFRQLRRPAPVVEHFWRAVLSTAPIPALSDEELIG